MRFVYRFLLLLAMTLGWRISDAMAESTMTPRGPARILGLVVPDFPEALVRAGSPLEVNIRLEVSDSGDVTKAIVESTPSAVDVALIDAAMHWYVVPDVCRGSKWTSSSVRATIRFAIEGERRIISIRDPRWFALGVDENLADVTRGDADDLKLRQPIPQPLYPKEAVRHRIKRGVVVGLVKFDASGKAVEIPRIFQWPKGYFEQATREAVMEWQVDADDPHLKQGDALSACFIVDYQFTY